MVTLAPDVADVAGERETAPGAGLRSPMDLAAPLVYLFGGVYLTAHFWGDPDTRIQSSNVQDQGFFQFVLAHAARSVTHLSNPLFDGQLNVPDGVNMMANTSILGLSLPLTPVTLLFGPAVSYLVLLALAPFLTAAVWYYVLSRHVVRSRVAAFVAGGFCGFAPGFVSQSNGHPNVAGQFMVPLILLQVAKLGTGARPVRTGVLLGLLVVWQAFINEEVLLFTALAAGLMALVYGVSRWSDLRAVLRAGLAGLGVAALVAAALLAYPLWFQFFGPQHYGAVPALSVALYSDVGSYLSYPTQSITGSSPNGLGFYTHPAEENAYYGWPLLILAVMLVGWLWRHLLVRVAAVVALFFAALSLGPTLAVYGQDTGIPGPLRLLNRLPLIESVVPVRFALMVIPALGVLLAIGLDRILTQPWIFAPPRILAQPNLVWCAAFLGALVPIFPTPLPAVDGPPPPTFVSAGTWRQYVPPGRSIVTVPVPTYVNIEGQRWSAAQELDLPIAGGYFLGPGPGPDARALYGPSTRPTAVLLDEVARTGIEPVMTDADRRRASEDLRFWRAAIMMIGTVPRADVLRDTVRDLLQAEPRSIGDAWVWDVRAMVG